MSLRQSWRRHRGRWLARLLAGLARLPLPVIHALGWGLGSLLYLFPSTPRRIAAANLNACLPELSPAARRRLLRQSLIETARGMLELGPLWLWPAERVLGMVREVDGEACLAEAHATGGVIVATPHLGAWEVAGLYVSSRYPITTLYRPSRLGLDGIIAEGRARLGAEVVPTDQRGVRALLQALRGGRVVGMLPDQDPGPEGGQFAPFFGQPANTMVLMSRLAQRAGVPCVLVHAERLPRGRGYRLCFRALPEALAGDDMAASLAALNGAVEAAVRALPAQYLWSYKRLRTRPPGVAGIY